MTGKFINTAVAVAILVLLAITGCASFSTYPPVEITGGLTNPSFEPLPTLMAESIRFAYEHYGHGEEDFAINLPEGVPPEIYSRVIRKLGGRGHPMTEPGENAYHVLQIRSRGTEAEVDLVYPRTGSIYEMVTLKFSRRLVEGWVVLSSRLWRIHVDTPTMNYIPPEPTTLPEPVTEPAPDSPGTDVLDEDTPPDDG